MLLTEAFYQRPDVTRIARDLLGKALFTRIDGKTTAGLIVETEAYSWKERGCHAYDNRKTARNAVMFGEGGHAYVYLCYGMYNLFNVVTNREGMADAVLIRALEPVEGLAVMQKRTGARQPHRITSGPGKLTRALGIDRKHNGVALTSRQVWLEDAGMRVSRGMTQASPRIGIDYAGEDALLDWRYTIKDNLWVSK
ncbi:MAG: DNA-3-methyladenine glycosylase [Cyclobacteriaceae bacterium]|nr:DNA-3-methyladenine glycosylase [Cyclobacteriaceae bacterium]